MIQISQSLKDDTIQFYVRENEMVAVNNIRFFMMYTPQRSVLGPLLFLLYNINDIKTTCLVSNLENTYYNTNISEIKEEVDVLELIYSWICFLLIELGNPWKTCWIAINQISIIKSNMKINWKINKKTLVETFNT